MLKSEEKIGTSLKKYACVDLDCIEQVIDLKAHKTKQKSLLSMQRLSK